MKKKIFVMIIIGVFLFAITPSFQGENIKKVEKINEYIGLQFYENVKDASILSLNGIINDKEIVSNSEDMIITQEIKFDPSDCVLHNINQRQNYLEINGLQPFGSPGTPMLPMKTIIINIPKNTQVLKVGISNVHYKEIKMSLDIIPNQEPVFWSDEKIKKENTSDLFLSNIKIYNSNQFYPGKVLSYQIGETNEIKQIFIRIYPIQYIPKFGKTILIIDGEIKLFYRNKEISDDTLKSGFVSDKNVIITPPSLFEQALELKNFHDLEGTTTTVINTSWLYDHYNESDDPPYKGYKNSSLPNWENLQKYDYTLAKRIISYLDDTNNHPELEYVTLLGNARLVPPSYYSYYSSYWSPTDFFYSSPDFDLVPNYFIGRLPVNNSEEASHVIKKIKNWNATSELFNNITVAGGKPFHTPYDIGEMITVDAINKGFFSGVNITKCYKTEDSFDKNNLTYPLQGNVGLLYEIGHGSGDSWGFSGEPLGVENLMSLKESDKCPIVASIACLNGAFDTNIVDFSFNISFGEGVLLSDAGGIAYIGGSRSNAGTPVFILDDGYVRIIKETYMAGMLTNLLESYHKGSMTLGNLTANAMLSYFIEHDFSDPLDYYTFFCFVLLGDPALKIPSRPTGIEYQQPYSTVEGSFRNCDINRVSTRRIQYASGMIPIYTIDEIIPISIMTNSPTVDVKSIDGYKSEDMVIERAKLETINNNITYNFTLSNSTIYCIRAIGEDGKEGWQYALVVTNIVDDEFNETTQGWNETRWAIIQNAIDHSNNTDMIYVFNGTYYENIFINKTIKLFGENSFSTIIDGGGHNNVLNINYSSTEEDVIISGFKILKSGKNEDDSGILINSVDDGRPNICYNEICNNQKGIVIQSEKTNAQIENNRISNNTYGVYSKSQFYIGHSTISNNKYGIYISNLEYDNNPYIYYNEISNNQKGIFIQSEKTNAQILINLISNNTYGILINSVDAGHPYIYHNIISSNTYGVYSKSQVYVDYSIISNNKYAIYLSNSTNSDIFNNEIKSNLFGIYLLKSHNSFICLNNFVSNKNGIYLDSSEENEIISNDFVDNNIHAKFKKCRNNFWSYNYWDNWLGLKFKFFSSMPKFIFGRVGRIVDLIPWINLDRMPSETLNYS